MDKRTFTLLTVLSTELIVGIMAFISYDHAPKLVYTLILRLLVLVPLFIVIIAGIKEKHTFYSKMMCVTFAIVAVADTCISFDLIIGLAVFAVVHLLNGINFSKLYKKSGYVFGAREIVVGVIIFLLGFGLFFFVFFKPLKNDVFMLVAILVYMLIISYAMWRAVLFYNSKKAYLFIAIALGAVLFYICDVQVAYAELVKGHNANEWTNSLIYYTGLYLLSLSTEFEEV